MRARVASAGCVLALAGTGLAVPRARAQPAPAPSGAAARRIDLPPQAAEAQRFLAQRGWRRGERPAARYGARSMGAPTSGQTGGTATWQPVGPTAVQTQSFGLVSGRVSAIALDPSDSTGNRLYVGTTGGGVWAAGNANASDVPSIVFTPLTDSLNALEGAVDASISIGALTVQPGATGVILAGTGDPNDALDSYYGAGILRSPDNGTTWAVIQETHDAEDGLSGQDFSFVGEGFGGFAWSTVNPRLVVAAVSQAFEGTLVDADRSQVSYEGLYLLIRQRRHVASGRANRRQGCSRPAGCVCGAGWQCSDRGGVEPHAAVIRGGGALSRLLPIR